MIRTMVALGIPLLLVLFMTEATAAADAAPQAELLKALRTDKRGVVTRSLALTETEAKRFWPIYDEFQKRLERTNRQRSVLVVEVVGTDKPISDLYARRLVTELLEIDEAELAAERRMQKQVLKALPTLKAARYLQLENKARATRSYELAATLPLVK